MTHSAVNEKRWTFAQRSLGTSGSRRGLAVLAMAAVVVTLEFVSTGVAEAKGTTKPPPIPTCYYTGSGYGDCEGYIIPGGGTVVPLTVAKKNDKFKLEGPAPLQSTKAVACKRERADATADATRYSVAAARGIATMLPA